MPVQNKVTLFSNGIADFVRSYPVSGEKTEISIPVKKQHVGDVLASLNLYGNVSLTSPPSFPNAAANALAINSGNTFEDLITKLSGAKVRVNDVEGTLMGLHSENTSTGGDAFVEKYVVVFTTVGVRRVPIKNITKLEFVDPSIQEEINKALQTNYQKIKPNSTFVNFTVKADGKDAEAVVQYNVPAAAWKICYRISEGKVDGKDKIEFSGLAVVDNNTDEDWKDVIVSVVTGEPITFSTDLADAKIPHRSHVNIVKDKALGSIEVEYGIPSVIQCSAEPTRGARLSAKGFPPDNARSMMQMASGDANMELFESAACESMSFASSAGGMGPSAIQTDNSSKEVGDFSVFTSKNPLTVAANTSAVIPVFQTTLADTKVVLHYAAKNNAQRPYRSLQFKNETEHSLGRGVCTFYQENLYSGTCVLPATKQNEDQLLPVSLETGVKVIQTSPPTTAQNKVNISNGLITTETKQFHVLNYVVHNSKDEEFEIYLDVPVAYSHHDAKFVATLSFGKDEARAIDSAVLVQGLRRYKFTLPANGTAVLNVMETVVTESKTELTTGHYNWLNQNYIRINKDFAKTKEVKDIVKLQEQLAKLQTESNTLNDKQNKLEAKQDRLRQNLTTAGNDEQSAKWRADLAKAEDEITKIEETELPKIAADQKELQNKIGEIMKQITFDFE